MEMVLPLRDNCPVKPLFCSTDGRIIIRS